MPRVLITDHVFDGIEIEQAVLEPLSAEIVVASGADEATLLGLCAGPVDGMLVCFASVGERVIQAAADAGCRIVSRYGIGYDNVDVATATRNGIVVTRVPDYCLDEVADHALALLISAARGVSSGQRVVREGGWQVPREVFRLHGRKLALVGVGQIGVRLARRALALELDVIGFDPYVQDWPGGIVRAGTLEEAISEADFVSLHAPLTQENRGLIGERTIGLMRRRPVIVNTARGGLVDLAAATAALDAGRLSWLALDVVDPEPLPADHPLRDHPRAIITPHMAFYSIEAEHELRRRAAEEVARAIRGELPECPVNPEVLESKVGQARPTRLGTRPVETERRTSSDD